MLKGKGRRRAVVVLLLLDGRTTSISRAEGEDVNWRDAIAPCRSAESSTPFVSTVFSFFTCQVDSTEQTSSVEVSVSVVKEDQPMGGDQAWSYSR